MSGVKRQGNLALARPKKKLKTFSASIVRRRASLPWKRKSKLKVVFQRNWAVAMQYSVDNERSIPCAEGGRRGSKVVADADPVCDPTASNQSE